MNKLIFVSGLLVAILLPAVMGDDCTPSPCGTNAKCQIVNDKAVCSCPKGYKGNPFTECVEADCLKNSDCSTTESCLNHKCVDPCAGDICGVKASCTVVNYNPICSCPEGLTGDPFKACN